jgi:hypothetical protein
MNFFAHGAAMAWIIVAIVLMQGLAEKHVALAPLFETYDADNSFSTSPQTLLDEVSFLQLGDIRLEALPKPASTSQSDGLSVEDVFGEDGLRERMMQSFALVLSQAIVKMQPSLQSISNGALKTLRTLVPDFVAGQRLTSNHSSVFQAMVVVTDAVSAQGGFFRSLLIIVLVCVMVVALLACSHTFFSGWSAPRRVYRHCEQPRRCFPQPPNHGTPTALTEESTGTRKTPVDKWASLDHEISSDRPPSGSPKSTRINQTTLGMQVTDLERAAPGSPSAVICPHLPETVVPRHGRCILRVPSLNRHYEEEMSHQEPVHLMEIDGRTSRVGQKLFDVKILRQKVVAGAADSRIEEYISVFSPQDEREDLLICRCHIAHNTDTKLQCEVFRQGIKPYGNDSVAAIKQLGEWTTFAFECQSSLNLIVATGSANRSILLKGALYAETRPLPDTTQYYQAICEPGSDLLAVALCLLIVDRLLIVRSGDSPSVTSV